MGNLNINWSIVKPSLWTGAAGMVLGAFLLAQVFGFMIRPAPRSSRRKRVTMPLSPRWRQGVRRIFVRCRMQGIA